MNPGTRLLDRAAWLLLIAMATVAFAVRYELGPIVLVAWFPARWAVSRIAAAAILAITLRPLPRPEDFGQGPGQ